MRSWIGSTLQSTNLNIHVEGILLAKPTIFGGSNQVEHSSIDFKKGEDFTGGELVWEMEYYEAGPRPISEKL